MAKSRYLKQKTTGRIYAWHDVIADRPDMVECDDKGRLILAQELGLEEVLIKIKELTEQLEALRELKESFEGEIKEVLDKEIRRSDGKPFETEKSAKMQIGLKKLSETHEAVEVSDGWVIKVKS